MGRVANPARAVLSGIGRGGDDGLDAACVGALLGAGTLVVDALVEGGWTWVVAALLLAVVTFPHEVIAPTEATVRASVASSFGAERQAAVSS